MGKGGASDRDVWDLARAHGCLLVTRDEYFYRLSVLHGAPPKAIWLRLGNCPTRAIVDLLRKHAPDISRFEAQNEATLLELG
jgi:predicted nuclease of predicted toxin-antitoxin system